MQLLFEFPLVTLIIIYSRVAEAKERENIKLSDIFGIKLENELKKVWQNSISGFQKRGERRYIYVFIYAIILKNNKVI